MSPDPFDRAAPAAAPPAGSSAADGEPAIVAAGRRKGGTAGAVLAGAMVAMRDLLEGPPREEIPIEVEASGQPHDVDRDGVRMEVDGVDVAAPALARKEPLPTSSRRRGR